MSLLYGDDPPLDRNREFHCENIDCEAYTVYWHPELEQDSAKDYVPGAFDCPVCGVQGVEE